MGLIPDDTIQEIRNRVDIVEVIGAHVQLKKAGQNHKGLCPFHQEKTPSFNVNGEKGFFYCFGCQKKGDAFTFVMEYEGKSFAEAARQLAAIARVDIPEEPMTNAEKRQRSERSKLFEINKIAARFFYEQLRGPAGEVARGYLASRGIGDDIAKAFGLGFAPDSWDALGSYLEHRRVPPAWGERAGLLVPRKGRGGYYDRFRNRLVCPVILPGGEVAGFSGRLLGDDEGAKYLNTPETAVFKKSNLLFGIHRARDGFRKNRRAIVVEGNFDVISLHQHGYDETVASLGTALTVEQVDQLRRLVDEVVLVYDGDRAGREAALKALVALEQRGVPSRIATPPKGTDPDDLVRSDAGAFATLVDKAQPGPEFFIYEVWTRGEQSAASRAQSIDEAAALIGSVTDPVKRDYLVGTLARAMGTELRVIQRALARHRGGGEPSQTPEIPRDTPSKPRQPPTATRNLELKIIAILSDHPTLLELAESLGVDSLLTDEQLRDMYSAARQGRSLSSAMPEGVDPQIAEHVFSGAYASLKNPAESLTSAVGRLKQVGKRQRESELQRQAQDARRRGDAELERRLSLEILELRKQVD